jgi:hypothetical protein
MQIGRLREKQTIHKLRRYPAWDEPPRQVSGIGASAQVA